MPTNRNNEVKEFAVGTKIEYNGKSYKVIESDSCADCSIANICSNSNIDDETGYGLSVDKRLNIFGECSSFNRYDSKSVVFVEVPKDDSKDNSKDEHYNIIPLWIDDNHTELKPVEFALPFNFIIDKDNSDLDKGIIKFKNKWLTLKKLYEIAKKNDYLTYRSLIKDFNNARLLALATFMDIISYFNGDWKFNAEKDNHGYAITFYYNTTEYPQYRVFTIDSTSDIYYGNPVFKNEADAQYVIDNPNFREVLDNIFKV